MRAIFLRVGMLCLSLLATPAFSASDLASRDPLFNGADAARTRAVDAQENCWHRICFGAAWTRFARQRKLPETVASVNASVTCWLNPAMALRKWRKPVCAPANC